jgi:hypothetical protein
VRTLGVAILFVLLTARPGAAATPPIALYTMGAGDDVFSKFGHAAVCVGERCYNYGTASFDTPGPLTWDFIRGRARFWVSISPREGMLAFYRRADRSVWRQTLTLPEAQAARLAAALEASTDEKVKYYRYHHFDDNCTTRIRDLVDAAVGGALRRDAVDRGKSFRQWARDGFAGQWPLLVVNDLLLGRPADRRTDSWSAMFLPSELRIEVERRLGAKPELIYQRKQTLGAPSTALGHVAFAVGGLVLALMVLALGRAGVVIAGLVLGLVGMVLWGLAALSTFPELTYNELLLVFWPTDLLLFALPRGWLRGYALGRLGAVALFAVLHAVGFTQPLSPALLAMLPLFVIARRARVPA